MKVIVINGAARTGKDTIVEIVKRKADDHVVNMSTIDPVKEAMKCLGWDGSKTDQDRLFMAKLKQLWIEIYNGPIEYIRYGINMKLALVDYKGDKDKVIYFVHCREPEEIQKLKDYFGEHCITLLIKRDGLDIPINGADDVVENYRYDHMIDNSGSIDDLGRSIDDFIKVWDIKLKHSLPVGGLLSAHDFEN